MLIGKGCLCI